MTKMTLGALVAIALNLQKYPSFDFGFSLKITDLIGLILFLHYIARLPSIRIDYYFAIFSLLFLVTSWVGTAYTLFDPSIKNYYSRFPEALSSFRFDYRITTLVSYVYLLFMSSIILFLYTNSKCNKFSNYFINCYTTTNVIITFYALYGLLFVYYLGFPDLTVEILDSRNNKPESQWRAAGFMSEAGFFSYMLSWALLIIIFDRNNIYFRGFKMIVIFIGLLLSFSTSTLFLPTSIFLYFVFVKFNFKFVKATLLYSFLVSFSLYIAADILDITDFFTYSFAEKISDFFSIGTNTFGSGAYRSYLTRIALDIFSDYPLFGVGVGNSIFYIYRYEYSQGIIEFGETITNSSVLSIFPKILAEYGLAGISLFLLLQYKFFSLSRKVNNSNGAVLGISVFMNMMYAFSITPEYSLFYWCLQFVYAARCQSQIKFQNVPQ